MTCHYDAHIMTVLRLNVSGHTAGRRCSRSRLWDWSADYIASTAIQNEVAPLVAIFQSWRMCT